MTRTPAFALLLFLLVSCDELPEQTDPVILDGIPSMLAIVDSLNEASAQSMKWSYQDEDSIVYTAPIEVDWQKEFQAFLKDDVNRLRYQDAYSITDIEENGIRFVTFTAKTEKQEIRKVRYELSKEKLRFYSIEKTRKNLLSSSMQTFTYDGKDYTLSINQRIPGLFENTQYVHGSILPFGKVWRLTFDLGDDIMPVLMIQQNNQLLIKNGEELLVFHNEPGSNRYASAYFNGYFHWEDQQDGAWTGTWVNAKYDQARKIPVKAVSDEAYRFIVKTRIDTGKINLTGDHRMIFDNENGAPNDTAVLTLKQKHHIVTGSVLTPTGDYRYLEGVIRNDSLLLSAMDGTHCYYFKALVSDNQLNGTFKAGLTWRQTWKAELGTTYQLPNASNLTKINSNKHFNFSFQDIEGNIISLDDPKFQDKPMLISIMGTWCSNCLDETIFLKEVADQFKDDLQIIALDFELVSDSNQAKENIRRYKENLSVDYPILLAGLSTTKLKVQAALPALNSVISYPTMLVLDRKHKVVRIHTGFSGPATGTNYYERFRSEYLLLIDSLTKA